MEIPRIGRSRQVDFNMTPMIDVVFLLIIFFLVSSHLAKQEVQKPLDLPIAQSGNKQGEEDAPRVTINVLADGSLELAGRQIQRTDLGRRLTDRLQEEGAGLQVRIRADRAAPYRFVEPIMLACARAEIWDVSFSVYRPQDVR